ncbi:MAG TPA: hypothetical protein VF268_03330, partial [Gammaproteobacteria bacterium]
EALDQVPGVTRANVIINGDTIHVRLQIPGGLTRTEIERIEQEAHRAVSFNLPRYRIVLTSNQSDVRQNERTGQAEKTARKGWFQSLPSGVKRLRKCQVNCSMKMSGFVPDRRTE